MSRYTVVSVLAVALSLGGCVTTSMQGYADRTLPAHPVKHLAAIVNAPTPLSAAFQASLASNATKRGIAVDDARTIFPPTRQYADAEIRSDLKTRGIDGLLIINVGDSGVVSEYAGTMLSTSSSGTASAITAGNMTNVSYSGSSLGLATPVYRRSRQTSFDARLVEPSSGRNLWVGQAQVAAGGALFVGTGTSASTASAAILSDIQAKGLFGPALN